MCRNFRVLAKSIGFPIPLVEFFIIVSILTAQPLRAKSITLLSALWLITPQSMSSREVKVLGDSGYWCLGSYAAIVSQLLLHGSGTLPGSMKDPSVAQANKLKQEF